MKIWVLPFVVVLLVLFAPNNSYGQIFGQDSEGFSSIVAPSATLNLDLANEIASLSYFHLLNSKTMIGGEIKGKSENGISNLFSESQLVSNTSLSALYGRYLNSGSKKSKNSKKYNDATNILRQEEKNFEKEYADLLANLKTALERGAIDGEQERGIRATLETVGSIQEITSHLGKIDDLLTTEKAKKQRDQSKIDSYEKLRNGLRNLIQIRPEIGKLRRVRDKIENVKTYYSSMVYTRWSANGISFREDLGQEFNTVDERFPKNTFNGFRAELGFNYHYGNSYFGINLASNYTNNIAQLEEREFTIATEDDSIEPGTLKTSSTLKAYEANKFDEFHRYDISFDYAYLIEIEGSDNLYLSLNPYFRHSIFHNSVDLKNSTNFGVGLFAFNASKSKILGGAFVQGNDVFGVNDKPESDLSVLDRFNFGLVVRFAFSGIDLKESKKE